MWRCDTSKALSTNCMLNLRRAFHLYSLVSLEKPAIKFHEFKGFFLFAVSRLICWKGGDRTVTLWLGDWLDLG